MRLLTVQGEPYTKDVYDIARVGDVCYQVTFAQGHTTSGRKFEDTKFLELYKVSKAARDVFAAFRQIDDFIVVVGEVYRLDDSDVTDYKKKIGGNMMARQVLESHEIGTYLFSAHTTLSDGSTNRQLCSYINEALRNDTSPMVEKVVPLVHIINSLAVTREGAAQKWPYSNMTYRGIGMPESARDFFTLGKIYRVPMFLATSFQTEDALTYSLGMAKGLNKPTLFIFKFDPVLRCTHAAYVGDYVREDELLLPPYSGFQVKRVEWSGTTSTIEIKVFADNQDEELANAPLAVWH